MKKYILHIIIALALIVFLNQLAIHSAKVYKDGASIVCEQKRKAVREKKWTVSEDKTNVLYFGASGVLSAIIPEVFDSLMNHQTYSLNLALPALPIGPYYHYLLDFLEHNPAPDYIIMTYHVDSEPILLTDTYGNQGVGFPGELFSYLIHRDEKHQIVNYLLPFHVYRGALFRFLYNRLFDPAHIEETRQRNSRIVKKMIEDRGYYFIMEQSKFPGGRLPEDYTEETDCPECEMKLYDPDTDIYVDKFFRLTEKLNTKVLLVSHPIREGRFKQFEAVPGAINKLITRYEHVSIPPEGWKLPFYENRYFADPHHLNKDGALVYTQEVAEKFRKVFLEDHISSKVSTNIKDNK
jgi:hypothetical protein